MPITTGFFRSSFDQIIDLRHTLTILFIRLLFESMHHSHVLKESNEYIIQRRVQTPNWQYYAVDEYHENRWPFGLEKVENSCKMLKSEGVGVILDCTIALAATLKRLQIKSSSKSLSVFLIKKKKFPTPPIASCWIQPAIT